MVIQTLSPILMPGHNNDVLVTEWIACLDKRPADRTGEDLDIIFSRLRDLKAFEKFHPLLLQQICYYSYYEDLEQGVILFRQGDIGTNWYAVLSGSLDVNISETGEAKDSVTLCTLGVGTAFGESVLNDTPRHATVITNKYCELLRVEQKDFRILWERNKQLMEGLITHYAGLPVLGSPAKQRENNIDMLPANTNQATRINLDKEDMPNPAAPITATPSEELERAGHVLRTVILARSPHMIRDRKYHLRTYRRCLVGTEMVDWLLQHGPTVHSRNQAVGMWQALLEEGVIIHVCHEHQFKDKYLFYRFYEDDQGVGMIPSPAEKRVCEDELPDILNLLEQIGPDAMMRMILRKLPHKRSLEDLEIIYEELLHIKALSHLSTMVKRELASVLIFESHAKAGTVLFSQGDEGKSWYIIMKGSVNVVISGKGVVCTLHEGDDFGKLALVNDAPRAATIVLCEDNCHFLRVDKEDFNRILRDVEANTVRLKEHGKDVLVLEKIPSNIKAPDGTIQSHYKYSVMAGTPEKMLEHLLGTCIGTPCDTSDTFREDFLLTHVIFMPANHLCPTLMAHYHANMSSQDTKKMSDEYALVDKKRVIQFVQEWAKTVTTAFWEDKTIQAFLQELQSAVMEDSAEFEELSEEFSYLEREIQKYKSESGSTSRRGSRSHSPLHLPHAHSVRRGDRISEVNRKPIKPYDQNIFKVYCADHTYSTLKLRMDASVEEIITNAAGKLCLGEDLVLCEVKSNGERVVFQENDLCITTGLSINGALFVAPREHLDALTPLPEQEGPTVGTFNKIELLSSRDIAYHLTLYDWELFSCVHEYELIYLVFGRHNFSAITANLDVFLRRFNEIQYWVITEMCLTQPLSKRVQLLRKFIKIAAYCKEFQNLNSFFAIVMGLSNIAVSRFSQTWEKVPNKFKKMFAEFEMSMDPSRNHRSYRLAVAKMHPPIIPFMPLLMKDMTFTHEGNKTHFDGLVNFEKMHMIAQTSRTVRFCKSKPLSIEVTPSMKNAHEVKNYVRNLKVIDNQRVLTQMSHKLEPRRS